MKNSAAVIIVLLLFLLSACTSEEEKAITVHVAASMTDAVQQIADAFTAETGISVQLNLASTGTLARQIAAGAPADVFISANTEWMDFLTNEFGLIHDSRIRIASNRLVVVVNKETTVAPESILDLPAFASMGIAIGDPAHVPAGVYAKEALERAAIWDDLEEHIIPALDVRAALAYVERGEVSCGIVYSSDSLLSDGVRTAFEIPGSLHSPITYEAAIPSGANVTAARSFMEFLSGQASREALKKYGFTPTAGRQ